MERDARLDVGAFSAPLSPSHIVIEASSLTKIAAPLRIGSWPGKSYRHNAFVRIFCEALEAAGAKMIDVIDPRRIKASDIDVLHIHWPEQIFWRGLGPVRTFFLSIMTLRAIRLLRKRGVVIVWMVHNLRPHSASWYKVALWALISRSLRSQIDGFVTLSPATLEPVAQAMSFPSELPRLGVRHPHYRLRSDLGGKHAARKALAIAPSGLTLAFVGQIVGYKGVTFLAEQFLHVKPGVCLVIAGICHDASLEHALVQAAELANGKIDLRLGRLSDADFDAAILAADYVVLPFVDYLHSGSIVHALSLGRAVLTPETAYARDLATVIGPEWVRTYRGALSPEMIDKLPPAPNGIPDLSPLSHDLMGKLLVRFLHGLRHMRLAPNCDLRTNEEERV